jgi:hypothetical protein
MTPGVIAVERSQNSKTGEVSATYVSQASCPLTCPFKGSGCYAESGLTGIHTHKLNKQVSESPVSPDELAVNEAMAIANLSGELPLRLHVVGDATTNTAARLLGNAASYYSNKHHQPVWTYTHAWRDVSRASWQGVSVLASCESIADAKRAREQGYAPALVVESHPEDGKARLIDGLRVVPCPEQTGKAKSCKDCRLCFDDNRLKAANIVIQFATHGNTKRANQALKVIQYEQD